MNESLEGTAELLKLREKVKSLSPPNQLRLAAELIERGKFSLAEAIAGTVVDELSALRCNDL